jgi:predicted transcriptional regulator
LGHLAAAMTAGCSVSELLAILERAAKHAEAMLQAKKWTESVVDSVQDKVKEYFGQVSPQPTQKELVP